MKYKVMDFNQNSSFQFRGLSSSISNSFHSNISACNLLRNYHYFIDAPNISREFSIKPFISEPSSSTNITEKNTKNYELNNFGLTNHRDRKFHHFLPKEVVFNQNHHQLLSAYPHSLPLLQNSDSFGTTLSSSASSVEIPNLSPKNRKHRSEKRPIPEAQKDVKYFERRRRNNHAAKKSRDARKLREDQIALRATILEHENALLRAQVITLREETTTLRNILLHSRNNNNNNNNNNKSFAELSTTEVPVCVITQ